MKVGAVAPLRLRAQLVPRDEPALLTHDQVAVVQVARLVVMPEAVQRVGHGREQVLPVKSLPRARLEGRDPHEPTRRCGLRKSLSDTSGT